ncbi:MAG: proline iminopeptidase [Micavibrio sp.]|nr:proline iminopeptidase [Micavibrio sp.]
MVYNSKVSEADWVYRPALRASGILDLDSPAGHRMYWEEYGREDGDPVLFIHGGPGGGTARVMANFFDPERYRIILFDQRGCGKSTPSAMDDDARPALADNTTGHLIDDINLLRRARGITGKMHILGGSWGSTLALAYALKHPGLVEHLILRGIFLCRRQDLDFFYQGNAATYAANAADTTLPGTYMFYPEAWKDFVAVIPPEERHDMVAAYARIFASDPANENERDHQIEAARAWSVWEGITSNLAQDVSDVGKFSDPGFAKAFARIENHYFMNGVFLGDRDQNYILENAETLKDIPVSIVHGRYDLVCPLFGADALVAALGGAGNKKIDYRKPPAGHSMFERENYLALVDIMDHLPEMK